MIFTLQAKASFVIAPPGNYGVMEPDFFGEDNMNFKAQCTSIDNKKLDYISYDYFRCIEKKSKNQQSALGKTKNYNNDLYKINKVNKSNKEKL